jgi:hypothetical protein
MRYSALIHNDVPNSRLLRSGARFSSLSSGLTVAVRCKSSNRLVIIMPEKTSRIILIIEITLTVGPISLGAIFATFGLLLNVISPTSLISIVLVVLAFFSLFAIASGWILFIVFFQGGGAALHRTHFIYWIASLIGCVILVASFTSYLMPPSPGYSDWWHFREHFNYFASGLALILPLGHLAAERFVRH